MLHATQLSVRFRLPGRHSLQALADASISVAPGEIVGIVGESGCGKSTLARALVGLVPIEAGQVHWRGAAIDYGDVRSVRALRRELQMVFQDPFSSLDPRLTIEASIAEPLASLRPDVPRTARRDLITRWLERVGLNGAFLDRYPHELSGGQCQRVAIARAASVDPALLICDEAVSALDVSVQAQIVALLQQLQRELGLALLFISHHLALVSHLAQRVAVLYLGRVVEAGPVSDVFGHPLHPYTRALIEAVPEPDPVRERSRSRVSLRGELPSPIEPPSGCVFRTRCPYAVDICAEQAPIEEMTGEGRRVACHRWRDGGNGVMA